MNPTGTLPSPRLSAGAAYDEVNDRLILFSGSDGINAVARTPDIWVLVNATGAKGTPTWEQLNPSNTGPVGRALHSAVYDVTANRLIVYGGCTLNCGANLSAAWILTNANGLGGQPEWMQLPNGTPSHGHVAGYDPVSNRMIVFGGISGGTGRDTNVVRILVDANRIGDPLWQTLTTVGTPPPARGEPSAGVYDPLSNRLILFGGLTSTGVIFGDVWVLTNANGLGGAPQWSRIVTTGETKTCAGLLLVID